MTSPFDDDDGTLAATEYAVVEQRVSLPVMFVRGGDDTRYERERVLGEGGMGIVELHRDKRIGRSVAVKLLRSELVDSTSQRRFLHEAQLQGQLEHPAIVPVYDIGEDKHGLFFTMKRIRGVTLHEVIVGLRRDDPAFSGKYSRRKLLSAFSQVCLAIDFAHTRGVLHRDLKPANIMLGDFGEVYVLDWGIAKVAETPDASVADAPRPQVPIPSTMAGSMIGTPAYMAPEQLEGKPVTAAADVYALGSILFELLALEPLHPRGLKLDQIMSAALAGGEHRPSARSPQLEILTDLDDIVVKALALAPQDRYAHARELHDAIESVLDGERDLERRRERSIAHLERALDALDEVEHGAPEAEIGARRRAMVEIGGAIAEDPQNTKALEVLSQLLTTQLRNDPAEVTAAMEHGEMRRLKQIAGLGGITYLGAWLFVPLIWWIGVLSVGTFVGMYAGLTTAGLVSIAIRNMRAPAPNLVLIPLIASNIGFGFIAGVFGPLVFVPTVAVVNTVAYAIHARRAVRLLVYAAGVGSFLVPLVLELAGAIPSSYRFGPDGMTVLNRALELSESSTLVLLVIAQIFAVTIGIFVVSIMRDGIDAAERSTYTYAWHLREWIPDSHKQRTDPVGRRGQVVKAAAPSPRR